ncbi:MAG: response regulator transcription factor [Candidatus Acidiferrales bacterium]
MSKEYIPPHVVRHASEADCPDWARDAVKSMREELESRIQASANNRKTVLIADDSEIVRATIRRALEQTTDFAVCAEAADGTDAVSKAKELEPDLIILDVRMPGLNGIEVAGILRHALPEIRIVLVTMYAEDFGKNFMSLVRFDAVLAKADGLGELTGIVTGLLGQSPA